MNWILRRLQAGDALNVRNLVNENNWQQLHLLDRAIYDPIHMRRIVARRYRTDVFTANSSLGGFHQGRLVAFALYGDGTHPITGMRERHLLDLLDTSTDGHVFQQMIEQLVYEAYEDGVGLMRLEVSAHSDIAARMLRVVQAQGFLLNHIILRRTISPQPPVPGYFELTSNDHRPFALNCLARAIANGLAETDQVEMKQIVEFTERHFRRLQSNHRISIIGLDSEREPRAHAVVELVPSRLRRAEEAQLFDIFVPAEWKGKSWSKRLWCYTENLLNTRGIIRAEGTLGINAGIVPDRLIESLDEEGWWVDRYVQILRFDLSEAL